MVSPDSASPTEKRVSDSMETGDREEGLGEEETRTRARKTETAPSSEEVEEHNLGHSVFRNLCPHCVRGRAESHGHKIDKD